MSGRKIVNIAAELLSEDSDNREYDRAIVEMTSELLGISHEHHDAVDQFLRAVRP